MTGAMHLNYSYFLEPDDKDESYVNPRNGFDVTPSFELQYTTRGYNLKVDGSWTNGLHGRDLDMSRILMMTIFSNIPVNYQIFLHNFVH